VELLSYFQPAEPDQRVRAVPGAGLNVPIWILGSSLYGAHLAAGLGLPYAFASHFSPGHMMQAIELYRSRFRPSAQLGRPYVMLGINVFAADTDEEGRRLMTSVRQAFVQLRRGRPTLLQPPVEGFDAQLTPAERMGLEQALSCTVVGSPESVRRGLATFIAQTGADELMVTSQIFDHAARLRSFAITAEARDALSTLPENP
jgi:luciferase family oxidoreductase group 1